MFVVAASALLVHGASGSAIDTRVHCCACDAWRVFAHARWDIFPAMHSNENIQHANHVDSVIQYTAHDAVSTPRVLAHARRDIFPAMYRCKLAQHADHSCTFRETIHSKAALICINT